LRSRPAWVRDATVLRRSRSERLPYIISVRAG
jgi:hypothetical protein